MLDLIELSIIGVGAVVEIKIGIVANTSRNETKTTKTKFTSTLRFASLHLRIPLITGNRIVAMSARHLELEPNQHQLDKLMAHEYQCDHQKITRFAHHSHVNVFSKTKPAGGLKPPLPLLCLAHASSTSTHNATATAPPKLRPKITTLSGFKPIGLFIKYL